MNLMQRILWLERLAIVYRLKAFSAYAFGRYGAGIKFGKLWYSDQKKIYDHCSRRAYQAEALSELLQGKFAAEAA